MSERIIAEGAEAKIIKNDDKVIKDRIKKSYRHPQLDEQIRISRTKKEAKLIEKAISSGVNVPKVIKTEKFKIEIEYIDGDKLSETLNSYNEKEQFSVMKKLGDQTSKLHKNNIIHGDLTTSNTILKEGKLFIIDFGLGFISSKIEDKAVDLHLIKQALEAKHFQNHEKLFQSFLKGYKWHDSKQVIERLKIVERRGRYKH